MKRILLMAGLALAISFVVLKSSESPKYYLFNDGKILSISGDSAFLGRSIPYWDGYKQKFMFFDTINIFTLDRFSKGFYLISPLFSCNDDPCYGMSVTPTLSGKVGDSIVINIHTPNYRDSDLVIDLVHDNIVYETTRKQNCYSVSVPAGSLNGFIKVRHRQLTSPIGYDGQYFGKLEFKAPLRCPDITTDSFIESVDVVMPNLRYRTLLRFYIPASYMRVLRDAIVWFGGMWLELDSSCIEIDRSNTDWDSVLD